MSGAYRMPPREHCFKPGQTGNPGGRAKLPEELRRIAALSRDEVSRLVAKYARFNSDELEAAVANKKTPMLELAIAAIFNQAAKYGDYQRLSFLLDRAIGKPLAVADPVDEEGNIRQLSTEELIEKAKKLIPELEAQSAPKAG